MVASKVQNAAGIWISNSCIKEVMVASKVQKSAAVAAEFCFFLFIYYWRSNGN